MKRFLVILAVSLGIAIPAQAHGSGNWFGPMLGGMIIGGVLVDAARPKPPVYSSGYSSGPIIIQQPAPVIVQQYEIRPQCRYENAFKSDGQYLGQIQVCN